MKKKIFKKLKQPFDPRGISIFRKNFYKKMYFFKAILISKFKIKNDTKKINAKKQNIFIKKGSSTSTKN